MQLFYLGVSVLRDLIFKEILLLRKLEFAVLFANKLGETFFRSQAQPMQAKKSINIVEKLIFHGNSEAL